MKGPLLSTCGLVLNQNPYGNDSALVSFATKEGIQSVYAGHVYGKKSPLKPLLLSMEEVKLEYTLTKDGMYLASFAEAVLDPSLLYASYPKNLLLQFLSEVSVSFFHYGDSYPLPGMEKILSALAEGKDPLSLALQSMGLIYQSLGLEEDVSGCALCGKEKDIVSYSLKEGGFLCRDCLPKTGAVVLDPMDLYVLKYAFLPLSDQSLLKVVPRDSGKRVLLSLSCYLHDYFDLPRSRSLPLFLEAL